MTSQTPPLAKLRGFSSDGSPECIHFWTDLLSILTSINMLTFPYRTLDVANGGAVVNDINSDLAVLVSAMFEVCSQAGGLKRLAAETNANIRGGDDSGKVEKIPGVDPKIVKIRMTSALSTKAYWRVARCISLNMTKVSVNRADVWG